MYGPELVCGVDFTVVHALAPTNLIGAPPFKPGYAAEQAAARKRRQYQGYELGRSDYMFCPAAWEAYGRIGRDALQLIRDIGRAPWVVDVCGVTKRGFLPAVRSCSTHSSCCSGAAFSWHALLLSSLSDIASAVLCTACTCMALTWMWV